MVDFKEVKERFNDLEIGIGEVNADVNRLSDETLKHDVFVKMLDDKFAELHAKMESIISKPRYSQRL